MSINALINELKNNNEDFEFYPTTKEMIRCIYNDMESGCNNVLDIGCGTCNFKKFFKEFETVEGKKDNFDYTKLDKYYVIEKSRILLNKLDKDTIVLGTDFRNTLLIDKKVEVIFCNPPYSEFEEWTKEIILNGNCNVAYLVIPQRWKDDIFIQQAIKTANVEARVIGSFDFLNAERAARAKVDVVKIDKRASFENRYYNRSLKDFNEPAFDRWFDETFKMRDSSKDNKYEWDIEREEKEKIKNQLVSTEQSKAKILVDLYNAEQEELFRHFQAICSLDVDVIETIGVKKEAVKEAIKQKVKSLKVKYWKIAFEELEEITSRLTSDTRNDMLKKFSELLTVDFTIENIYPLIIWVIKNANEYYDNQLIEFFKNLSSVENAKPYKSNHRIGTDNWRFADKNSHYALDYRIICDRYHFHSRYSWEPEIDANRSKQVIENICTIANNLGFATGTLNIPNNFGEKCYIYLKGHEEIFMEYKVYKNGNTHIKFNKEFMKAMNVEVSRLLGWIKSAEDIKKEFPEDMAKGAEKYFKANYTCIGNNGLLMLTTKREVQDDFNK